jgi:hypothetical protein
MKILLLIGFLIASCLFFVNNVSVTPTNTFIPNPPPTNDAVALEDFR